MTYDRHPRLNIVQIDANERQKFKSYEVWSAQSRRQGKMLLLIIPSATWGENLIDMIFFLHSYDRYYTSPRLPCAMTKVYPAAFIPTKMQHLWYGEFLNVCFVKFLAESRSDREDSIQLCHLCHHSEVGIRSFLDGDDRLITKSSKQRAYWKGIWETSLLTYGISPPMACIVMLSEILWPCGHWSRVRAGFRARCVEFVRAEWLSRKGISVHGN